MAVEFGRETLASVIANYFTRRAQAQEAGGGGVAILEGEDAQDAEILGLLRRSVDPQLPAEMRDPFPMTIPAANDAERAIEQNPNRKRFLVQNIGPGNAFVVRSDRSSGGIKILPDGAWIDEFPYVHTGEVWVYVDVANTVVHIAEWV